LIEREKLKINRLKPRITTAIRQTDTTRTATVATTTTATTTTPTDEATEETVIRNNNIISTEGEESLPTTDDVTNNEEELCGFNNGVGFIVGGQDAKRGAFPFVAILGYKGKDLPVVNFIKVKNTNFTYERRFGSFYYVHVTRKKLPK